MAIRNFFVLIGILYLLYGCGPDYEWDTKIIFQGKVTDQYGQPLAGIKVCSYISDDINLGPWGNLNGDEIISETITDAEGNYILMFPRPEEDNGIMLLINMLPYRERLNEDISSEAIYNIRQDNFDDYRIDFGIKQLYRTDNSTTLTINLINDDMLPYFGSIIIDGFVQESYTNYNFYNFYDDYIPYPIGSPVTVAKNQILTIKYQEYSSELNANPVIREAEVSVGDGPVTYTIPF